MILFKFPFQVSQRREPAALELVDPAILNLIERNRIQVVELFPALPDDGDEIGVDEQLQVLRHRLARHFEMLAELPQRLPVLLVEDIQKLPAAGIAERLEYLVRVQASRICK